jgi:type III restriction enzyme
VAWRCLHLSNERLGFFILYRNKGLPARYVPDFIVETDTDLKVIVEIKGRVTDDTDVKAKAAQRWVNAVNRLGQQGTWHYLLVKDPGALGTALNAYTTAKWDKGQFGLSWAEKGAGKAVEGRARRSSTMRQ